MAKQEPKDRESPWCPPAVDGIDLNGCRTPKCDNFGIPPTPRASGRHSDAEIHGYTVYNFHLRGQDGKTPAQRLGLIDGPLSLADLCANSPVSYSLPPGKK